MRRNAPREDVGRCPRGVYVAPLPGMDALLALTTPGTIRVLEEYDEGAIRVFVARDAVC